MSASICCISQWTQIAAFSLGDIPNSFSSFNKKCAKVISQPGYRSRRHFLVPNERVCSPRPNRSDGSLVHDTCKRVCHPRKTFCRRWWVCNIFLSFDVSLCVSDLMAWETRAFLMRTQRRKKQIVWYNHQLHQYKPGVSWGSLFLCIRSKAEDRERDKKRMCEKKKQIEFAPGWKASLRLVIGKYIPLSSTFTYVTICHSANQPPTCSLVGGLYIAECSLCSFRRDEFKAWYVIGLANKSTFSYIVEVPIKHNL